MNKITVEHYQDNGQDCVSVSLKNHDKPAILFQSDFNRLIEAGIDPRWKLLKGQIVTIGRKPVNITRLVAEVAKGVWIGFFDHNPCNLKKNNLKIGRIRAKPKPTDLLTHKYDNPHYIKEIINGLTK